MERSAKALDFNTASNAAATPDAAVDQFKARDVVVDHDGTEHVRFDHFYAGLPVIGGDVVVHSNQGKLMGSSLTLQNAIKLDNVTLAKADGRTTVQNASDIGIEKAVSIATKRFASRVLSYETPELVVLARGKMPVLAYAVRVYGDATVAHGPALVYYVSASNGQLLSAEELLQTAAATGVGKSLHYGDVSITTDQTSTSSYRMVDPTRGNGSVADGYSMLDPILKVINPVPFISLNNVWGNNTISDRQTVAADIMYGLAKTWDYYKNTNGRNGIFNDGKGVPSYAHVTFINGLTGANAAWGNGIMYYGDGQPGTRLPNPVVSIDVAGHELSHGVNQATANLAYISDSGGLNESNSDIFGTLVKFYVNNPNDPGNYVIGAKIVDGGLRKMYKQDVDGRSFVCYPSNGFTDTSASSGDANNAHYTSGVGNRFFYLLAEGATVPLNARTLTKNDLVCNGDTGIAGIGRDKAGKIWYRALTIYLTSNSTYPDARMASMKAAADLYGDKSPEQTMVARAWSAVSVN